ncbi:MAG: DNA-directed RNA polymerase subunit B [Candidatus Aenigmarchaeota archaeon]|nr:DNA-directed RNA polymerase subunit B [Candidatus Aenigmarchaeota archaeon]
MKKCEIFLDGKFLGYTNDPVKFVKEVREKRRSGILPTSLNVAYYEDLEVIHLFTEGGRVRRPLIVVENGKPKLTEEHIKKLKNGEITFSDLVKNGIIEFLDCDEEENSYIAINEESLTKEHTHLEIHPALIFGFSASYVPFPEFDRGDRVNYGAKMNNQAISIFLRNVPIRTDTKSNLLLYSQVPLVQTHLPKAYPKLLENVGGLNAVVAITSYDCFNTEDAIVINLNSVMRGMFWSMMYRTYVMERKRYMGGQTDEIKIPEQDVKGYKGEDAYRQLQEDGIIYPEAMVTSQSVLVGRVSPLRFLGGGKEMFYGNIRDSSITLREGDKGIVDKVFVMRSINGEKMVKVTVRDLKIPEVGDKFANRHGQKGVCALLVPQEDMPFTKDGIVPDIVFNPHGLPSRMTVGMLLEMLFGKAASLAGSTKTAVPFEPLNEEGIKEELIKFGFKGSGNEIMYDGITGKMFESEIFIGPCYFEKLDHLVSNKIHARSRGPVTLLTKQPTEGRSREGGLRLGEMEKDVLLAHGAVVTLKERFDSDKVIVPVCSECGLFAIEKGGKKICLVCGESKIYEIEMSYAFKLMLDELKSMHIYPKIVVSEE